MQHESAPEREQASPQTQHREQGHCTAERDEARARPTPGKSRPSSALLRAYGIASRSGVHARVQDCQKHVGQSDYEHDCTASCSSVFMGGACRSCNRLDRRGHRGKSHAQLSATASAMSSPRKGPKREAGRPNQSDFGSAVSFFRKMWRIPKNRLRPCPARGGVVR